MIGNILRAAPLVLRVGYPAKIFLACRISDLLFCFNPTHRTKMGTSNRWETASINPLKPIKLFSQSITGGRLCCAFYQPQHPSGNAGSKSFCSAKLACFDFSSSNFLLLGHIPSTGGVALTYMKKLNQSLWT